jgi:hypothetical protein
MKTSIVVAVKIIDLKATETKPARTLVAVCCADGAEVLRTIPQFENDLRGSGFELKDANGETRYRKGFEQTTYPNLIGLAVSGDYKPHAKGDKYLDDKGKPAGTYDKPGYHIDGFFTFSKPTE